MPLSLADVLSAQAGGGPVYEGGPDANVTPGGVLSALGLGGPSWLDAARKQGETDIAAYQRGGVPEMMADTGPTQELAGGFVGSTTPSKGIRAYHGSPYDFEKFDISKIGTGEGFQKYGHGLYFAENPAVAESYKATGFQAPPLSNKIGGSADLAVPPGKMYEVNINAEPGQFLNWDAPLSEQPAAVNKLRQLVTPNSMLADLLQQFELKNTTGQSAYRNIPNERAVSDVMTVNNPNPQAASAALREAGIPGIRYLDQGSRGVGTLYNVGSPAKDFGPYTPYASRAEAQQQVELLKRHGFSDAEIKEQIQPSTSNYVVFNPDIVDILKKYGLAGLTMGGVLSAAGQEPAPTQ